MKLQSTRIIKRKWRLLLLIVIILTIFFYLFYDQLILVNLAVIASNFEIPISVYPFNVYHYKFQYLTMPVCKGEYDLVFLVKSTFMNSDRRLAIRETWGREDRPYSIRTIFILGSNNNKNELLNEHANYGDVLVADFYDTYDNLSLKCMVGINWARNNCGNSKFYALVDDDSYISTKNLFGFLNNIYFFDETKKYPRIFQSVTAGKNQKIRLLGGEVLGSRPVQRFGKYAVSVEEFPEPRYPDYIDGHTVVMSRDVLDELHEAAKHVRLVRLDDIYLSFLAMRAGLPLRIIPGITQHRISWWDVWGFREWGVAKFDHVISSHYLKSGEELLRIWSLQEQRRNV